MKTRIHCEPTITQSEYKLHKILSHLNCVLTDRFPELSIWCRDSSTPESFGKALNQRTIPIDKQRLLEAHKLMGYSMEPEEGMAVAKPNNSRGHGYAVRWPAVLRKGYSYSRLLTNHPDKPWVEEWRCAFFRNEMVLTRTKRMKQSTGMPRAMRIPSTSEYNVPVNLVMDNGEFNHVRDLCRFMGVDYGELDLMRDLDGKLYVLDVNSCPSGPSFCSFTPKDFYRIVPTEAEYFARNFL